MHEAWIDNWFLHGPFEWARSEFRICCSAWSPQFRWDGLDGFGELLVKAWIYATMPDGCTCRIRAEIVAAFPVVLRADRPGTKTTAAIRADIFQDVFDALTAEGAFKRTNHRFRRIRRQRHVAVLASWSQFEHLVRSKNMFTQKLLLVRLRQRMIFRRLNVAEKAFQSESPVKSLPADNLHRPGHDTDTGVRRVCFPT